jgi:hypothetical protein
VIVARWQRIGPGRWDCWALGATACRTDYGWCVWFQGSTVPTKARTLAGAKRRAGRRHRAEGRREERRRRSAAEWVVRILEGV